MFGKIENHLFATMISKFFVSRVIQGQVIFQKLYGLGKQYKEEESHFLSINSYYYPLLTPCHGGGRTRLPKFKFSANFPLGLHVFLQIEI